MSPVKPLPPRDTRGPMPVSQCALLADLAARAREADNLSYRLISQLPAPLRGHVSHAGLRNDRLLLLVESPVWATRARMQQQRILASVNALGLAATSVTTKVVPPLPAPADTVPAPALTPHAVDTLRNAAAGIADPDLRALFLELADRAASSRNR